MLVSFAECLWWHHAPNERWEHCWHGKPWFHKGIWQGRSWSSILLQKIKTLGITGKLGVWMYHFLTYRTNFVRLQGGISHASPVLSDVPQGNVLAPLLFLILMGDVNSGISSSSIVSLADDTRLYHGISNVDDCMLNSVYDWASCNNMSINSQKFQYICFSPHSSSSSNVYTSSSFDIINYSKNILDLGIHVCVKQLFFWFPC